MLTFRLQEAVEALCIVPSTLTHAMFLPTHSILTLSSAAGRDHCCGRAAPSPRSI